jgi:hypothetical protein
MAVILAAIFKMATKMFKISKCYNFNENWYVGFFPHEEYEWQKQFENGVIFLLVHMFLCMWCANKNVDTVKPALVTTSI